ncbi:GNAT family N-acetyltransferase [Vreelandella titanicae]|uniref:MSMEG_0567/Sll0786 family nitrogen starvation N-acetyltransferase n=1 Tax=Halomonadaceae TaxID=28256 RepID=UPI00059B1D40|nr:MSMEG_0567/Sll0786 family nitrogen starvation N-acetyltransferase [Halomonas sp. KHS3]KIN13616.1 histone acetyltransferase [Halomonas sp. KHS3]
MMSTSDAYSAYSNYRIKWVSLPWETDEALALRRRVFCDEQAIFDQDDRDAIDESAHLLVALGCTGGWYEQVVGTVRIHESEPGLWHGSRLAVDPAFRAQGRLGSTLIRLAVSSAHALGCQRFLARVQAQNEALFQQLHWRSIGEELILDRPHVVMEADLTHYPPCHSPLSGFVVPGRQRQPLAELAPGLLKILSAPALRQAS